MYCNSDNMSYIGKRRSDMFLYCCIELPWLLKSIPTNHFDFFGIILKILSDLKLLSNLDKNLFIMPRQAGLNLKAVENPNFEFTQCKMVNTYLLNQHILCEKKFSTLHAHVQEYEKWKVSTCVKRVHFPKSVFGRCQIFGNHFSHLPQYHPNRIF